jgi:hypothetical protein
MPNAVCESYHTVMRMPGCLAPFTLGRQRELFASMAKK